MAQNCLGRAYLLGKVLQRRYQVDIHGFFSPYKSSQAIWQPCDTGEFNYKTHVARRLPGFLQSSLDLLKSIDGDIIYASKLRLPSYGVGLMAKVLKSRPLLLDIDDIEVAWGKDVPLMKKLRGCRNPMGQLHSEIIEHFVGLADDVTTVSSQLKARYGRGTIIPHGKDTDYLNPSKFDRNAIRAKLGLTDFYVIMFLGTPRPHKGLEDIIEALNLIGHKDVRLVVVGAGSDPVYEKQLSTTGKNHVIMFPQVSILKVPEYISAADLIVLPQRRHLQSHGQIPAKLFDAMAMAKPIIATNVSDMGEILTDCGIVVEPENVTDLANSIELLIADAAKASELGRRARERCIRDFSWKTMESRLSQVIEAL